jgi:hypothetical protein
MHQLSNEVCGEERPICFTEEKTYPGISKKALNYAADEASPHKPGS